MSYISSSATGVLQAAALGAGNGTPFDVTGMSSAVLTVNIATTATVVFEGTQDGINYAALNAVQLGTSTIAQSTSTAGATLWETPVGGLSFIRARISSWTAGAVTVTGQAVSVGYTAKVILANAPASHATGLTAPLFQVGLGGYNAAPAPVTNAQYTRQMATLLGAAITRPYSIPQGDWSVAGIVLTNVSQALVAAGAAGVKNYLTCYDITTGATFTANTLQFLDGATVKWEIDLPAGAGKYTVPFPTPLQGTAATAFNVKATGAVTGTCKVNATGYQAAD